jgi:hypothetical protein
VAVTATAPISVWTLTARKGLTSCSSRVAPVGDAPIPQGRPVAQEVTAVTDVVVEEEGELQLLLATGAMVAMVSSSSVRGDPCLTSIIYHQQAS